MGTAISAIYEALVRILSSPKCLTMVQLRLIIFFFSILAVEVNVWIEICKFDQLSRISPLRTFDNRNGSHQLLILKYGLLQVYPPN